MAFPLAVLLMLGVTGVESVLQAGAEGLAGASVVRFQADTNPIDFQSGWILSGTLSSGTVVSADKTGQHPELHRGHAVLRSTGFTELTAGSLHVSALAASYAALHDESSTTVAALTAPVIVSYGSDTKVLVPGMQLTVTTDGKVSMATVPSDWFLQQMQTVKLLADSVIPSDASGQEDAQADVARMLSGGRITADSFTETEKSTFDVDSTGTAQRLFLLRLLQEESRTESEASALIAEAISKDRFLATELITVLPLQIGTLQKPVAEPHIRLWEKSALSLGLTDSASAIAVLHTYADFPEKLTRAGYPEQSMLWQHALAYVGTILRTTLSGDALTSMDATLTVINQSDIEEAPEAMSAPALYVPATDWSESELIAIATQTLSSKGVLMAVTTELAPDTPTQTVRVSGVFIAEQGSDVPYVFTFDVARNLITDIKRSGKELPNTVPVDVFFR